MITEMTGYVASALVLLTFMAKDARLMRVVAIFSNLAFMIYGALANVSPVLFLHILLLGVNAIRLAEIQRDIAGGEQRHLSFTTSASAGDI
jgi:hypothetical protein